MIDTEFSQLYPKTMVSELDFYHNSNMFIVKLHEFVIYKTYLFS